MLGEDVGDAPERRIPDFVGVERDDHVGVVLARGLLGEARHRVGLVVADGGVVLQLYVELLEDRDGAIGRAVVLDDDVVDLGEHVRDGRGDDVRLVLDACDRDGAHRGRAAMRARISSGSELACR